MASGASASQPASVSSAVWLQSERTATGAALALFAGLQVWLGFRLNINWDEYFFLSHVYAFLDGRLTAPFQTFHVHLFAWLPALPLSEADQIGIGRMVMLACELATFALMFATGRAFLAPRDALAAVAAYALSGYVLAHGMSFRTDPPAAMLMMAALWLMIRAPLRWPVAVAAGLAAALALLITVKSALYLPAFGAALLHRFAMDRRNCRKIMLFFAASAAAALICYATGWLLHSASLPALIEARSPPAAALAAPAAASLHKTVASPGFFPQFHFFARWVMLNPAAAAMILGGIGLALAEAIRGKGAGRFVPLLLAAPLASLLFYRNAYPYFYPFILAPAALCAGLASQRLDRPLYRHALLGAMAAGLVLQFTYYRQNDQAAQRAIAEQVHAMFPQPVRYIDRNAMIPSFEKSGLFLSTWGIEGAIRSGKPFFAPVIADQQPPLLIANSPILEAALAPGSEQPVHLAPADTAALRGNYIPHWGPVWVAGKQLSVGPEAHSFAIAIAGNYTVECNGAVRLDNVARACGSVIALSAGPHRASAAVPGRLTLRWGDHLMVPRKPPPQQPIYYGF